MIPGSDIRIRGTTGVVFVVGLISIVVRIGVIPSVQEMFQIAANIYRIGLCKSETCQRDK
jgi:membrane-associated HD superfamily phosphohydrolase